MSKKEKEKLKISENLFMFIYTETTGFPERPSGYNKSYPYTDTKRYDSARIVRLSWAIHDYHKNLISKTTHTVKPTFVITNSHIHGITQEIADSEGVEWSTVVEHLKNDLKNVKFLITHNLQFHLNILLSELHRSNHHDVIQLIQNTKQTCVGEQTRNILKIPTAYGGNKMPSLSEIHNFCFKKDIDAKTKIEATVDCFFKLIK